MVAPTLAYCSERWLWNWNLYLRVFGCKKGVGRSGGSEQEVKNVSVVTTALNVLILKKRCKVLFFYGKRKSRTQTNTMATWVLHEVVLSFAINVSNKTMYTVEGGEWGGSVAPACPSTHQTGATSPRANPLPPTHTSHHRITSKLSTFYVWVGDVAITIKPKPLFPN